MKFADTLVVIDNDYERRYYYSSEKAAEGAIGWLMPEGRLVVYREDQEATRALNEVLGPEVATWRETTHDDAVWRRTKKAVADVVDRVLQATREVRGMGIVKHGTGEVLPDDNSKTAAATEWTEDDAQELAAENAASDAPTQEQ